MTIHLRMFKLSFYAKLCFAFKTDLKKIVLKFSVNSKFEIAAIIKPELIGFWFLRSFLVDLNC